MMDHDGVSSYNAFSNSCIWKIQAHTNKCKISAWSQNKGYKYLTWKGLQKTGSMEFISKSIFNKSVTYFLKYILLLNQ